jgi:hypothetical protein
MPKGYEYQGWPKELGQLEFEDEEHASPIMEGLRKRLAVAAGVTVVGPYLTLRFKGPTGRGHTEVQMLVMSIKDDSIREYPDDDGT